MYCTHWRDKHQGRLHSIPCGQTCPWTQKAFALEVHLCVCVGGGGSDSETVHARALVHAGTKRYECVLCLCDVSLLPYGNASQAEELFCSLRH